MRWPDMDESKRCTATAKRTGRRCERAAVVGARVCRVHGGGAIQVVDAGRRRIQEQKATEIARRRIAGLDLRRYSDPFAALEFAVSASYAMAERLTQIAGDIPDTELVWRNKTGEHVRGELVASMKALADLRAASEAALRLNLDARRAGITQQTVDMLDRALTMALNASGIGFDGQAKVREVFRRHIQVVSGGGEPESA